MNGDAALNPGENAQIAEGTTLTITATPNSGYEILSLQVNGEDFTSGNTYVVNQNVTITASFQFEGPKAVLVPEISGQYKYQFRFDDKVLGDHENGVNNTWNNGNVTGIDHRARNFTMSAWIKAAPAATARSSVTVNRSSTTPRVHSAYPLSMANSL